MQQRFPSVVYLVVYTELLKGRIETEAQTLEPPQISHTAVEEEAPVPPPLSNLISLCCPGGGQQPGAAIVVIYNLRTKLFTSSLSFLAPCVQRCLFEVLFSLLF